MLRQPSKVYLRGSIFNNTMKNLTPQQLKEVEDKLDILLYKTPSLNKSREKFCQTLANTIGADYRDDKEAALQEYKIALMKAIIYVLYHKPNRQILNDPIQTRKLFSQFTYNYMKQILNENKRPKDINEVVIEDNPFVIAQKQIINILNNNNIHHTIITHHNKIIINGNMGVINLKTAKKIGKIKREFAAYNVLITADNHKIEIINAQKDQHKLIKTKLKVFGKIHEINLDNNNDHNVNDDLDVTRSNIEHKIIQKHTKNDTPFDVDALRNIMPKHLIDVFNIIMNESYINKNKIAKILNISTKEVNNRLQQIKYYYYALK